MGFFWLFSMSQLSRFVIILSFSLYSVFTFLVSFYSRSVSSPFIFFSQIGVRYKSSMVTLIYIRSLFFHSCSVSFIIVVRPLPFLSIHRLFLYNNSDPPSSTLFFRSSSPLPVIVTLISSSLVPLQQHSSSFIHIVLPFFFSITHHCNIG